MTWTPADDTPILWVDADGLTAGDLSTWSDQSGNGNDLTAGTAPLVVESVLDGKSVVQFDRGSSEYLTAGTALGRPDRFSIFTVLRMVSSITLTQYICGMINSAGSSANAWAMMINNTAVDGHIEYQFGNNTSFQQQRTNTSLLNTSTFHVYGVELKTAHAIADVYRDGTLYISGALTTNSLDNAGGTAYDYSLGRAGAFNGNYAGVQIAEHIVYADEIGDALRQKVEGYLHHKWGLEANLPAGHPYKTTAPQNNTASVTLTGFPASASGIAVDVSADRDSTPFYSATGQSANGSGELAIAATNCPLLSGTRTVWIRCTNSDGLAGGVSNNSRAFYAPVSVTVS